MLLGYFSVFGAFVLTGAAHKFAAIRASWPADAPVGRDMKCMRCVACATTRQRCAFCFSLFRSFVPIGIVSKARTTWCQVWRFRVGSLDALFFLRRGQPQHRFTT